MKQEERIQIIINSFVKFQMEKEKLITIPEEEVEVKGTITPTGNVIRSYYETLNTDREVIYKRDFQVNTNGSSPLVKETVFNPLYILASFVKDKVCICAWCLVFYFFSGEIMTHEKLGHIKEEDEE